jgi:hypothetical protein
MVKTPDVRTAAKSNPATKPSAPLNAIRIAKKAEILRIGLPPFFALP